MGSSGRGTGEEIEGLSPELLNLGSSGSGTGDDMEDVRLEVPSLGVLLALLGGMGGLDWGLGRTGGVDMVSGAKEGVLRQGLGQRKAGLLVSFLADGLK